MKTSTKFWALLVAVAVIAPAVHGQESTVVRTQESTEDTEEDDVVIQNVEISDDVFRVRSSDDSSIDVLLDDGEITIVFDGEELSLEGLLNRALEYSPELHVAEADYVRAIGNLRGKRIEVVRRITDMHRQLAELQRRIAQNERLVDAGRLPSDELAAQVAELKAVAEELGIAVGEIDFGISANPPIQGIRLGEMNFDSREPIKRPEMNGDLANAMEQTVSITFEDTNLAEILEFMSEYLDINFVVDPEVSDSLVTINVRDIPVEDALLALSDVVHELVFVVREYGVLALPRDRGVEVSGPAIPNDLPFVERGTPRTSRRTNLHFAPPVIPDRRGGAIIFREDE